MEGQIAQLPNEYFILRGQWCCDGIRNGLCKFLKPNNGYGNSACATLVTCKNLCLCIQFVAGKATSKSYTHLLSLRLVPFTEIGCESCSLASS